MVKTHYLVRSIVVLDSENHRSQGLANSLLASSKSRHLACKVPRELSRMLSFSLVAGVGLLSLSLSLALLSSLVESLAFKVLAFSY